MKGNIKNLDVEKVYDLLEISSEGDDLNKNSLFDIQESDEHLAWKPLKI